MVAKGPYNTRPDLTRDQREELRYAAHLEAERHACFPKSVKLNRVDIPICKWDELQALGQKTLSQRALNLRDLLDTTRSNFFEHHKSLALRPHAGEDVLARWFISVQLAVTNAVGYRFTPADFGAPADENHHAPFSPRNTFTSFAPPRSQPCWSQEGMEEPRQKLAPRREEPCWSHQDMLNKQQRPQAAYAPARHLPCWSQDSSALESHSQHFARREEPCWSQGSNAHQVQSYQGAEGEREIYDAKGSRFDEAARIRGRQNAGSIAFG